MTVVLDSEPMPVALIEESALRSNIDAFAAYCRRHRLELAPHVKTTMSPELFALQREAGAWGATVANVPQAQTVHGWGERRLVIANEVADPASLAWIVDAIDGDDHSEVYFWVDSLEGVRLAEREHARRRAARPLTVLVEAGYDGGRGGCRDVEELARVAAAVSASARLRLCGVAGFEGLIADVDLEASRAAVDRYLDTLLASFTRLDDDGMFESAEPLLSVGGSAFVDRVAAWLGDGELRGRVLIRSGCYVTHDCGIYARTSSLGGPRGMLRSALEVWAPVLSTPEPGLALLGLGRRDVSFDAGMPVPIKWRRPGEPVASVPEGIAVTGLNDQHAYVGDEHGRLSVGDLVGVGISHPCTTFDKWRVLHLVDQSYERVGEITTCF